MTTARFTQRALLWAFSATLALGIAGCGSEAKERKTFIDFLQTRIVNKPGLHVPRLTPEEEKSFGEYSKHFAVIKDFNGNLDTKVSAPMKEMIQRGVPRTASELVTGRADLVSIRDTSARLRATIGTELAKADAEHARLKQPEDLKVVYDKAYTRTVSEPAKVILEVLPAVEATMSSAEKFSTFLEAHKNEITFRGSMMEVSNPTVLEQANVLMKDMNDKSGELNTIQRKLSGLVSGPTSSIP